MKSYNAYAVYDKLSETVLSVFVARNDEVAKKSVAEFCKKQGLLNKVDYENIVLCHCSAFYVPDETKEVEINKTVDFYELIVQKELFDEK